MSRDWKQEAHDQGEKDGAEGKYEPPYGVLYSAFLGNEEDTAINDAYDVGHTNGENNPSK